MRTATQGQRGGIDEPDVDARMAGRSRISQSMPELLSSLTTCAAAEAWARWLPSAAGGGFVRGSHEAHGWPAKATASWRRHPGARRPSAATRPRSRLPTGPTRAQWSSTVTRCRCRPPSQARNVLIGTPSWSVAGAVDRRGLLLTRTEHPIRALGRRGPWYPAGRDRTLSDARYGNRGSATPAQRLSAKVAEPRSVLGSANSSASAHGDARPVASWAGTSSPSAGPSRESSRSPRTLCSSPAQ